MNGSLVLYYSEQGNEYVVDEYKFSCWHAPSATGIRQRPIMSASYISLPGFFSLSQLFHWVKENQTLSLGILLGFIVLYTAQYVTSPYRKLPPGPRGYPIIGNVLELRSQQWLKFTEWRKQYGRCRFNIVVPSSLMSCVHHQAMSYTSMLLASL